MSEPRSSVPGSPSRIDAHQHFWNRDRFHYAWQTPDLLPLLRNYEPGDLKPHLDRAGIAGSIFVQALHDTRETDWLLELTLAHPWIVGIIGWLDLTSPALADDLPRLRENECFVGVRHNVHDEPDERWLLREDVLAGLKMLAQQNVPFDLLVRPHHLPHVATLCQRVPTLQTVVDHLAKPNIRAGQLEPWRSELAAVAAFPGVSCKLSGLITEAGTDWTAARLRPFVETALELFGSERLLFGSDWPVCRLAGEYAEVVAVAESLTAQLSAHERAALFGGNAHRVYSLNTPESSP